MRPAKKWVLEASQKPVDYAVAIEIFPKCSIAGKEISGRCAKIKAMKEGAKPRS